MTSTASSQCEVNARPELALFVGEPEQPVQLFDNPDIHLEDYDRWLRRLAIRAGAKPWSVTDSDQYGDCLMAFVEARRRFDRSRGVKFITYLKWWVLAELNHAIRRDRGNPGTEKRKAIVTPFSQFGDADADKQYDPSVSMDLDSPLLVADTLARLLSCLDMRSRRLVDRYYLQDFTLEEVGRMEQPPITKMRVLQIVKTAFKRIQKFSESLES